MKSLMKRSWLEDDGVLSFEWILLATLLAIGIVAGLSGARDAVIDELSDVAGAAVCIDQSYTVGRVITEEGEVLAEDFSFRDRVFRVDTGERATAPTGQTD